MGIFSGKRIEKEIHKLLLLLVVTAALGDTQALCIDYQRLWKQAISSAVVASDEGQYAEAEKQFKVAVRYAEKFGPRDLRLANTLSQLAQLYQDEARFAEAERLYKRSLGVTQSARGPTHPDVAASLNNLATLYRDQGQYARAETLYKRSLGIVRRKLGPFHPDVATGLNNLASLYEDEGLYVKAEPLYKRAFFIWQKTLGPNDPNVAVSMNNLASLYDDQKKYALAEMLYKQSLAIKEQNLGPNNPSLATSLNNLARVYMAQGRYPEAKPVLDRALTVLNWPGHAEPSPVLGRVLANLGTLNRDEGDFENAEDLYQRSLKITKEATGPRSPDMAKTLADYAVLLRETNRSDEARKIETEAKAIKALSSRRLAGNKAAQRHLTRLERR